ncbi:hypothetical protein ACFRR7_19520 [Streptomyces sp. NPDC056909]|uniref:hypothetical protein n=1 Tax=Streptomyces sp. NPDC056909 TaxID=3345963 RepID=UPI00367D6E46
MSSPEGRAEQVAARLSEAGLTARFVDHDGHICVEAEVPDLVSAESWQELLAVLETGDSFGLAVTGDGGRIAWVAISKNASGTAGAVPGHTHQL